MSLVLDLPPDLESKLVAEAARLGLPLTEYAMRLLAAGRIPESKPRNGAELIAYWQEEGLIGTRLEIVDAPEYARASRLRAENRERS